MLSSVDPFGIVDHDSVDQFVDRGCVKLLQSAHRTSPENMLVFRVLVGLQGLGIGLEIHSTAQILQSFQYFYYCVAI